MMITKFTKEEFIAEVNKAVEIEIKEIEKATTGNEFKDMADSAVNIHSVFGNNDIDVNFEELKSKVIEEGEKDIRKAGDIVISSIEQIFKLKNPDGLSLFALAAIKKDAVADFLETAKRKYNDEESVYALAESLKTIAIEYKILQRIAEAHIDKGEAFVKLSEALNQNAMSLIDLAVKLKASASIKRLLDTLEDEEDSDECKEGCEDCKCKGFKTMVDATENKYKN